MSAIIEKVVDFNSVVSSMKKIETMKDTITFTVVSNDTDAKHMLTQGADAKKLGKELDAIRKEILKPAREFEARVQEVFKPVLEQLGGIEKLVKRKIDIWETASKEALERIQADKQAALALLGIDMELPEVEQKRLSSAGATILTRKTIEFEVTDLSQVPREMLRIDEDHVKLLIKQGVRNVPGLRIFEVEKKILRSS